MGIDDFIEQITVMNEKELERYIWEVWLAEHVHMTEENFQTYEEMLAKSKKKKHVKDEAPVNGYYVDQVFF